MRYDGVNNTVQKKTRLQNKQRLIYFLIINLSDTLYHTRKFTDTLRDGSYGLVDPVAGPPLCLRWSPIHVHIEFDATLQSIGKL